MTDKFNRLMKLFFFALFAFLFLTGTAFCQEEQKEEEGPKMTREAQLAMVEAQKLFEQEDWTNARKPLLDFLATDPEVVVPDLYLMLGYCWYRDEKTDEAIKVFKKGHEEYPDNFDLLSYYATTLYETEQFAKAAPLWEELYEKDPKKQSRFLEAAYQSYFQIDKFEDTIRVIKKLIKEHNQEIKQNWYTIIYQLYQYELNDLTQAEKYIKEALKLFPMEPNFWSALSILKQEKEDYYAMTGAYEIYSYVKPPEKESEWNQLINIEQNMFLPLRVAKNLKKSIKDDINKEEEQLRIADSYARALKIDEAVAYIDGILKKKPSSKLMLKKAEILFNARRNKETITVCDDLINVNKDEGNGKAYFLKGNAAWDLKDWDTMEEAFKRAQSYKDYKEYAKYALSIVESINEAEKQINSDYKTN